MKAYYTEVKNRKKFVYIQIDLEDAKKIFAGIKHYKGDKELHLTTDHCFNTYIKKRKRTPLFVHICQNTKELNNRLKQIGVYL